MATAQRASRRRWLVYCVMVVCGVFLVAGLLHSVLANDPDAQVRIAAARSLEKFHQLEATSTSRAYTLRLLREVDAFLVAHGAPPRSSVDVSQFVFVSCNRHDQDQDYWRLMATAAQCEVASWAQRAQSPQCFALYAGVAASSGDSYSVPVEKGACGAVLPALSPAASGPEPEPAFSRPVDALVWLGDAIYADKREGGSPSMPIGAHADNPLPTVERFWITQRRSPIYTNYRHTCLRRKPGTPGKGEIPRPVDRPEGIAPRQAWVREDFKLAASAPDVFAVYGTWDDHDMGQNDGGADYPHRRTTQRFLLNFIGAEKEDVRWSREGVHDFRVIPFREEVVTGADTRTEEEVTLAQDAYVALQSVYENAMCVILLDSRSFRSPPNATEAGDMLGQAQWDWLEETLIRHVTDRTRGPTEKRHCALTLIGTGIQLIFDEKPGENWGAFPRSRDKLFGLLKQHGVERAALLTGDIHMGEIGLDSTYHAVHHVLGYPIIEITSSGLTHSAGDFKGLAPLFPALFPTPRRVGIYMEKNFASIRLSFDTERLKQHVRPLLEAKISRRDDTDANAAVHHGGGAGRLATVVELQHALEAALNVSFTSYAIARFGQPAVRLNVPLEAMTTRRGPQYAAAGMRVVHPESEGYLAPWDGPLSGVVGPSLQAPVYGETTIESRALGKITVPHYPNSSPPPLITWIVRTAQYTLFRSLTISQTLGALIKRTLLLGAACALFVAWCVHKRTQRRRRGQRQSLNRAGSAPSAALAAASTPPATGSVVHKRRSDLHTAFTEQDGSLSMSGLGHGTGEMASAGAPSPPFAGAMGGSSAGATSVSVSGTAGALYDLLVRETKQKTG